MGRVCSVVPSGHASSGRCFFSYRNFGIRSYVVIHGIYARGMKNRRIMSNSWPRLSVTNEGAELKGMHRSPWCPITPRPG
jgi:hypothetical protein